MAERWVCDVLINFDFGEIEVFPILDAQVKVFSKKKKSSQLKPYQF